MPSMAEVITQVFGPGGALEIGVEDVLGVPTQAYKQRMRSLRELIAQNSSRPDVTFLVQGDRRLTYGEHDQAALAVAVIDEHLGDSCLAT